MNVVLKLILVARKAKRKNPNLGSEFEHIYDFTALKILSYSDDWNWAYELSKTDWAKQLYHSDRSDREVKRAFYDYQDKACYYDAFEMYAEELIRKYKKKEKRPAYQYV